MSAPAIHVLFICTGNTCRSPMAEAFMRKEIGERKDIIVSSAGVAAYDGSLASRETQEIVENCGASLEGFFSRQVTENIAHEASYIFCLTKRHARTVLAALPDIEEKIHLIGDFVEIDGTVGMDIPDPFGMGVDAYEHVSEILNKAVPNLISFIDQSHSS